MKYFLKHEILCCFPGSHHPYRRSELPNHHQHHHPDKRNRNPNWTDAEIMRFLNILQEEGTMRDLMAQRNKQVISSIAFCLPNCLLPRCFVMSRKGYALKAPKRLGISAGLNWRIWNLNTDMLRTGTYKENSTYYNIILNHNVELF